MGRSSVSPSTGSKKDDEVIRKLEAANLARSLGYNNLADLLMDEVDAALDKEAKEPEKNKK